MRLADILSGRIPPSRRQRLDRGYAEWHRAHFRHCDTWKPVPNIFRSNAAIEADDRPERAKRKQEIF